MMFRAARRLLLVVVSVLAIHAEAAVPKANVVIISVDDLNDWVGVMGGHPQAKTPGMDYLASKGVLFNNAHCQSPVCNPSRASLFTSQYPSTTGIYFLNPDLKESPVASKITMLPKRFLNEGYSVFGAGKLYHGRQSKAYWPNWQTFGGAGYPKQTPKISKFPGHPLWDWGVVPEADETMPDYKAAGWAEEELKKDYDKPFLMGVGFSRPHVPQYATQKWFDLYPMETLKLPKYKKDDLSDLSDFAVNLTRLEHVAPTHEWVVENKEWANLVQSYLASVSFADAQVERVVKAVENSKYKDNTYVVLFSDHGFHIGEKDRHAKRSLWEDSTRVPLMIAGPGIKPGICEKPVQLLDIYPTVLALTGLKPDKALEGNDLSPLLENPKADWPHYARSNFGPGNYAIISEHYRFITYFDGSEEFYDSEKDPEEWNNVIGKAAYAGIVKEHRSQVPEKRHPVLGSGSTGHKTFEASKAKLSQ